MGTNCKHLDDKRATVSVRRLLGAGDIRPLQLENDEVGILNELTYLESCVTSDGDLDREVWYRIVKAARLFACLKVPIFQNNHLSIGTKKNVYWAVVLASLFCSRNLNCEGTSKEPDNFQQSLCSNHSRSVQVSTVDEQHYNRARSYSFWHGRDIGKHCYVTLLALAWSPCTYIWRIIECQNCSLERWCRLDPAMPQGKGGVMSLGQTCRQLVWQLMSGMKLHSAG